MSDHIGELDKGSIIRGVERVAGAYAAAPTANKSLKKFLIVFSLGHAAVTAVDAVLAAEDPGNALHWMKDAADEAERAVRGIRALSSERGHAAALAARADYEVLVRKYGQHDIVVIGDPVDCFEQE